jgi:hypothetical protein
MPQSLPDGRLVSSEEKPSMPERKVEEYPPEPRRKEIFQALVDAQDQEMGVAQSRRFVAERFGVTESQVRKIEQEGLDHEWPPL